MPKHDHFVDLGFLFQSEWSLVESDTPHRCKDTGNVIPPFSKAYNRKTYSATRGFSEVETEWLTPKALIFRKLAEKN